MDRNLSANGKCRVVLASLSARRAWIEINSGALTYDEEKDVALRKESVDRNSSGNLSLTEIHSSLSARRAWIEM